MAGVLLALTLLPRPAASDQGPSFSCARVTSTVNRLICATPALAALDRELAALFNAMLAQPTVDAAMLRTEEEKWVADLLRRCSDIECIAASYTQRIAALRAKSARAASPAAADETQPFPAPEALMAAARGLIGKTCAGFNNLAALRPGGPDPLSGFVATKNGGFILDKGGTVFILEKQGSRFAFLFVESADKTACQIADAAVLPPASAGRVLDCAVPDGTSPDVLSRGFGMRNASDRRLAYWEIDTRSGKLIRQPLDVLNWRTTIRCREPEMGE